jgi:K+-transporting ATPase KdpF subunit
LELWEVVMQPRWSALYALDGLMLALLGVVDAYVPPGAGRRTLELAIVVVGFGAMRLWVRMNRRALDLAGARDVGFRTIVGTEESDGHHLSRPDRRVLRPELGAHQAVRAGVRRDAMLLYVVGGVVAVGLMVYLVVALLKPELFS